ncbi:hypothetical protein evm_007932 [Chilo suppressalis]|nr:hypothetical protein evm_007932 [Chilo suppressalis]
MFFLDAPGGTGKTVVTTDILADVRRQGKIAIAVALSGIAATLLPGGKTAHAMFKIPINLESAETPVCVLAKALYQRREVDRWCFQSLDRVVFSLEELIRSVYGDISRSKWTSSAYHQAEGWCPDFASSSFVGEAVFIQRIPHIPHNFPFQYKRVQFPIPLQQTNLVLSDLNERAGDPEDIDNCETLVTFDIIFKAKSKTGEWRTVVQSPEKNYVQRVRMESCKQENEPCFTPYLGLPRLTTYCKQQYTTWEFVVEATDGSDNTEKIATDLPTCCSCHYNKAFIPF